METKEGYGVCFCYFSVNVTRGYGAIIAESETAFPVDKRKGEKNNTNITIF